MKSYDYYDLDMIPKTKLKKLNVLEEYFGWKVISFSENCLNFFKERCIKISTDKGWFYSLLTLHQLYKFIKIRCNLIVNEENEIEVFYKEYQLHSNTKVKSKRDLIEYCIRDCKNDLERYEEYNKFYTFEHGIDFVKNKILELQKEL